MKFRLLPSLIAIALSTIIGLFAGILTASKNGDELQVAIVGNFGAPISIAVTGKIPDTYQQHYEITGTGKPVAEGDQVLVRVSNFGYGSGGYLQSLKDGEIEAATFTKADLGDLYATILGAPQGSRIVAVFPGEAHVNAEIVVLDILPTVLTGAPRATSGLPAAVQVSADAAGLPTVSGDGSTIGQQRVGLVIAGEGEQISKNDSVYVNYLITDTRGQEKESTYQQAKPSYVSPRSVFPGLAQAMLDQRVGSRIVATIPAAQGRGDGDLVVVMDILARDSAGAVSNH